MTSLSLFTSLHWRRKWQPTPAFLPGESQGWGSLVGCCLWDHTGLDTTEVTAAAESGNERGNKILFMFIFFYLFNLSSLYCFTCCNKHTTSLIKVKVKVAQPCLTLCHPMDYKVHGISPGQNTGVGRYSSLQGIFPIQGLNQGLLHCRKILYRLSHKGSPNPKNYEERKEYKG